MHLTLYLSILNKFRNLRKNKQFTQGAFSISSIYTISIATLLYFTQNMFFANIQNNDLSFSDLRS